MSNEWFGLVLRSDLASTTAVAVMMVLADAADADGVCWPSVDFLVTATRAGRSTVLRTLAELEADGFLTRRRRRAQSTVFALDRERLTRKSRSETSRSETSQSGTSRSGTPKVPERDGSKENPHRTPTRPKRSTRSEAKPNPKNEEHPDARKLCDRLAELMVGNGCKPPTISTRWLTDARLLLTADGREFDHAVAVLEWSQADTFWRKNVLSMPKFRERYDQLRLAAEEAGALTAKATAPSTPDSAAEWVRQQWRDADVTRIEQATGLRYETPDLPLEVDGRAAIDEWFRQHRRQWITDHHDTIINRLTKGNTA